MAPSFIYVGAWFRARRMLYNPRVSTWQRIVVWAAASAICFALVFPLAPTPTLLGKQSIVAVFAVAIALVGLSALTVETATNPPISHRIRFSALLDLTCVRLC